MKFSHLLAADKIRREKSREAEKSALRQQYLEGLHVGKNSRLQPIKLSVDITREVVSEMAREMGREAAHSNRDRAKGTSQLIARIVEQAILTYPWDFGAARSAAEYEIENEMVRFNLVVDNLRRRLELPHIDVLTHEAGV